MLFYKPADSTIGSKHLALWKQNLLFYRKIVVLDCILYYIDELRNRCFESQNNSDACIIVTGSVPVSIFRRVRQIARSDYWLRHVWPSFRTE